MLKVNNKNTRTTSHLFSRVSIFDLEQVNVSWVTESTGPLNWPTQTKKFLPKKCLILTPKKQLFEQKNFSHSPERTNVLPKEKHLI